jgi:hypothetical protein
MKSHSKKRDAKVKYWGSLMLQLKEGGLLERRGFEKVQD